MPRSRKSTDPAPDHTNGTHSPDTAAVVVVAEVPTPPKPRGRSKTAPSSGEETPAVLVHCRVSDPEERGRLRDDIRERVRAITGITPVVELVPPRTLPRTSSGKLSRTKARNLYLTGEIVPYDIAA